MLDPAIATLILALLGATALTRSACTHIAITWLARTHVVRRDNPPAFVILLPVLREQALVTETLRHFTTLDYPSDRYRIVVVTSQRENVDHEMLKTSLKAFANELWAAEPSASADRYLTGHLPRPEVSRLLALRQTVTSDAFQAEVATAFLTARTTGQLVDDFAALRPGVVRIDAPADFQRKAGQLRFAFDQLDEALAGWEAASECRYAAVYDFDARPEKTVLWAAADAARSEPPVLQQPGLTVPRDASRTDARFMVMDGQLHARLGLRVELWNLLLDRSLPRPRSLNALLRSSIHSVGNGLFIDRGSLSELGGIPEVVDDLAIGWRAAASAVPIAPIRSPVFYDAYTSAAQAARSREFICTGYLRAVADIRAAPERIKFVLPFQLVRIYYRLLQWTAGPAIRVGVLAYCATASPWHVLAVCGLIYATFLTDIAAVRRYWGQHGVGPRLGSRERIVTFVLSPAALITYGAGARTAIWRSVLRRPSSRPTKTER